jgi:Domain of unknown function (DUF4037)
VPLFVPAATLSAAFHAEVVVPLLDGIPHAAALVGPGSEVLGFDDLTSTDHSWGPRMHVFVAPDAVGPARARIDTCLPDTFQGRPVRTGSDRLPVTHHVTVTELGCWLAEHLGVDARAGLSTLDWLTIPQQALLEATAGPVFADPGGELGAVRATLAAFPPQVRLWMLAGQWVRIAQEEAFVGRTAQAGDELGSRVIAARQVRELMRVAFLLAGAYWPYTKWFGTAFARLPVAAELSPPLERVLRATSHTEREAALVDAYGIVARAHNAAGLTKPVDEAVRAFHDRPFRVLGADRFATACRNALTDADLRALPSIGSVDQVVDSTDVLTRINRTSRLRVLYARS